MPSLSLYPNILILFGFYFFNIFVAMATFKTSCSLSFCLMLLCYSPYSIRVSPQLLHLIFQNTNGLEKVLPNILNRLCVNAILRLCYQSVTLQKWTILFRTRVSPLPVRYYYTSYFKTQTVSKKSLRISSKDSVSMRFFAFVTNR